MDYPVHILTDRVGLENCPVFQVNHFQWRCTRKPETNGQMGYLPGEGFLLRMTCREENPKREYFHHGDPVCKDSAMEAFFALPGSVEEYNGGWKEQAPSNQGLYLNLEVNANGAMYAKYGQGRQNRHFFDADALCATGVRSVIEKGVWTMELLLPQFFIESLCGIGCFLPGDVLYCNFYKICEDPEAEHYASYHPVESEMPNFHLPRYFGRAVLTE